ncbi:MAG: O-antigen ligase family protein [Bryobacter sp.]|nr:O-antigen ligase family protein [Bryobacter sp.]
MSLFATGRLPQAMLARQTAPVENPNFQPTPSAAPTAAPSTPTPSTAAPLPTRPAANPFSGVGVFFLSVFLFFLFSRVLDFKLNSLHLPLIFSSICLLLALASGVQRALRMRVFQLLLGLTVWMVICIPFSVWRAGSFEVLKETWSKSLMAGFIVAALIQTSGQALRVMRYVCFAFLATGILGLLYSESLDGRLMLSQGSYSNPNDYATAILYGCVCWYFPLHNPRSSIFVRIFSLGVIGFLGVMLLKTGSRGALITAILTFIPVFWRYSVMKKLALVVALPVVAILGLLVLPSEMRTRYTTFFSRTTIENAQTAEEQAMLEKAQGSSQQRLQLLKDAIRLTFENPLFGVGPGMFAVAQNEISVDRGQSKGAWLGTHNTYFQVSSETGFPGFFFFVAALVVCWRDLRRLDQDLARRRDAQAQEVQTLAFTLRLLLLSSFIFFMFEHIPFSPFVPVVACWISAFAAAARQELLSQSMPAPQPLPAGPRRPAIPSPVFPR